MRRAARESCVRRACYRGPVGRRPHRAHTHTRLPLVAHCCSDRLVSDAKSKLAAATFNPDSCVDCAAGCRPGAGVTVSLYLSAPSKHGEALVGHLRSLKEENKELSELATEAKGVTASSQPHFPHSPHSTPDPRPHTRPVPPSARQYQDQIRLLETELAAKRAEMVRVHARGCRHRCPPSHLFHTASGRVRGLGGAACRRKVRMPSWPCPGPGRPTSPRASGCLRAVSASLSACASWNFALRPQSRGRGRGRRRCDAPRCAERRVRHTPHPRSLSRAQDREPEQQQSPERSRERSRRPRSRSARRERSSSRREERSGDRRSRGTDGRAVGGEGPSGGRNSRGSSRRRERTERTRESDRSRSRGRRGSRASRDRDAEGRDRRK